ncbi:MAG: tetratricopeptide repeat protein [Symploca sp. SIO2E9]|nr:tetratricopeptide repeat protein [Symploca sp. SIO2E9]
MIDTLIASHWNSVNGAQLAALRRVSRESIDTALIIDKVARELNTALRTIINKGTIVVPNSDRLDRTTLKIFTRCILLLRDSDPMTWEWHLKAVPNNFDRVDCTYELHKLWTVTRSSFIAKLQFILDPHIQSVGSDPVVRNQVQIQSSPHSLEDVSIALVLQNYDSCFLWTSQYPEIENFSNQFSNESVNLWRGIAIASVNTGHYRSALKFLELAYFKAHMATLRAHLCYIQGLVMAKRLYDIEESNKLYERGLHELESITHNDPGDTALEQAWIFNGFALNSLLAARLTGQNMATVTKKTFTWLQRAFDLVREGASPERVYLRFNLLRNISHFLEIQQHYDLAIKTWQETFEDIVNKGVGQEHVAHATVNYRLGYLHYKASHFRESTHFLNAALESIEKVGCDFRTLRILRAIGTLFLVQKQFDEASEVFTRGLELSLDHRLLADSRYHLQGLVMTYTRSEHDQAAYRVLDQMRAKEPEIVESHGFLDTHFQLWKLPQLDSSLPNTVAEVDLEDIPSLPVSKILTGAVPMEKRENV